MAPTDADLENIANTFSRFAEMEARENNSPLYERLSAVVAQSPDLCALAANAREGQPKPNMLFAAVQFLLADRSEDSLAAFYPGISGGPAPTTDPAGAFVDFCGRQSDAIIALVQQRMVQTNEVRRSACLLPAFSEVARATSAPLALIEIGPSAGLNLLFDHYQYSYDGVHFGPGSSPVVLDSELRGAPLQLPTRMPVVASRMGIDLNPLDLRNDDDLRWLQALIWPEHDDRRSLFAAAASVLRSAPPRLLGGDVFELLSAEVANAPVGAAVCIFATFVLNQFSVPMLERLRAMLLDASKTRDLWMVVMGGSRFLPLASTNHGEADLWLLHFSAGTETQRLLALCNPHGRWITWY